MPPEVLLNLPTPKKKDAEEMAVGGFIRRMQGKQDVVCLKVLRIA